MDDDEELLPRHVLEAHTVPELPYDFTDRVMGALQVAPTFAVPPRRSVVPWAIAACTSAIAIAAMLVLVWARPPAAEPAVVIAAGKPEPPSTIAVAVPTPVATPAAPQLGHLVLTVAPRDATVRIDGQSIAGPSPFVETNLSVGTHAITVEHEGFETWSRTIDVPIGELDLPIALMSSAPVVERKTVASVRVKERTDEQADTGELVDPFAKKGTGVLRIGTNHGIAPAQVFVDGKPIGLTPIAGLKVPAGKHVVKWKWPDGREVRQAIDVAAGETKLIRGG